MKNPLFNWIDTLLMLLAGLVVAYAGLLLIPGDWPFVGVCGAFLIAGAMLMPTNSLRPSATDYVSVLMWFATVALVLSVRWSG